MQYRKLKQLGTTLSLNLKVISMDYTTELENKVKELTLQLETEKFNAKHHEEITTVVEKNLQAYKEALAEANETTRIWKKRYNDLSAHINSINPQNAELVARVEQLRLKVFEVHNSQFDVNTDSFFTALLHSFELIEECVEIAKSIPDQHLRQIQADAVLEFAKQYKNRYEMLPATASPTVISFANEYVAHVKAGE